MKILNVLKLLIKYGAYITIIIDVVNYAIDKFEAIQLTKETKE